MKITQIEVFQVELPLKEADYRWSEGKSVAAFDSTVVAVHTDAGIVNRRAKRRRGKRYNPARGGGERFSVGGLGPAIILQRAVLGTN